MAHASAAKLGQVWRESSPFGSKLGPVLTTLAKFAGARPRLGQNVPNVAGRHVETTLQGVELKYIRSSCGE